jgi:hypothetical protein
LSIAWNPDPFPTIGGPSILPVAWNPFSIRGVVIIIWPIVTGRGIIPSVINSRGAYPYRWGNNNNPEMAMATVGVSVPG